MTILDRLYASSGPEIIYDTFEIDDGTNSFRFIDGWTDTTFTTAPNVQEVFTAIALNATSSPKNEDGSQDITLSLSNIDGIVSNYIISNIQNNRVMTVKRRIYTSNDLTTLAAPMQTYQVKGGSFDALGVTINAGYFDILNTLWPRAIFDLDTWPGLRYL